MESAADASAERCAWLWRLWRCPDHEDCFGNRHRSSAQLRADAASGCTETCPCWRHKVLRAVDEGLTVAINGRGGDQ